MNDLKRFYFSDCEQRRPDPPVPYSQGIEFIWQILAMTTIGLGAWYLWWRWTASLNPSAILFSYGVVMAETCAFVGLVLYFHNLWATVDTPQTPAPKTRSQVVTGSEKGPITVDVFLPTFNEDPELTRYSIQDAKAIKYPHPISITVHILDDGNRPQMKRVATEEGVNYLTRPNNVGYKAGNLRNGMEKTSGDFIVILDSDTRPFPTFLENTLGYFTDPNVAWVQTPQWFYDIPQGQSLAFVMESKFGTCGGKVGAGVETIVGPVTVGKDPFINDATLFYEIILRRRNRVNASFCCGAGSVHRREAVMEAALKTYSTQIEKSITPYISFLSNCPTHQPLHDAVTSEMCFATEMTPYKFHVSEDIYTSILLHEDKTRNWKSVLHPTVESKMLSPLDMQSWAMQRFKYAGGTLDIMFNDNPLFRRGLSVRQKLMYAMTFWSYLAPLWNVIFIAAPIIALLTGLSPVNAYSLDFFAHLLPFLLIHELASIFGTWGINNSKGKLLNLAFFSLNLQALWAVVCRQEIKFKVTPKARSEDLFLILVAPQIVVVLVTLAAIFYAGGHLVLGTDHTDLGSFVINGFWASLNAYAMTVLISAALWKPQKQGVHIDVKNRLVAHSS